MQFMALGVVPSALIYTASISVIITRCQRILSAGFRPFFCPGIFLPASPSSADELASAPRVCAGRRPRAGAVWPRRAPGDGLQQKFNVTWLLPMGLMSRAEQWTPGCNDQDG